MINRLLFCAALCLAFLILHDRQTFIHTYIHTFRHIPSPPYRCSNRWCFWLLPLILIWNDLALLSLVLADSLVRGCPTTWSIHVLRRPRHGNTRTAPGHRYTSNLISTFNGVNSAGGVLGAVFTAWFANFAGRKKTIQLACIVQIGGGAICAGAVNPGILVAS